MYFDDSYIMYDHNTRKKHKKHFKDTYTPDMQYTRRGLLEAINKWNRDSIVYANGRYIYHARVI